jgi:manganese efflux pump family protein
MMLTLAVSLAMDASAVAIGSSIKLCRVGGAQTLRMSLAFGFFQFLMPVAGWALGSGVAAHLQHIDHWVAFALLAVVGGHMIWESRHAPAEGGGGVDPTRGWRLLVLSIATSIDALAVGLSLSLLHYSIWLPSAVIGVVTAALTALGLQLGCKLGNIFGRRLDLAGGLLLIGIGVVILVEHLK